MGGIVEIQWRYSLNFYGDIEINKLVYFDKLVIGKKKKRYISSIKLREGNLVSPYKPDVKGFEFMKSTTSQEAKVRFDNIVRKYIL